MDTGCANEEAENRIEMSRNVNGTELFDTESTLSCDERVMADSLIVFVE